MDIILISDEWPFGKLNRAFTGMYRAVEGGHPVQEPDRFAIFQRYCRDDEEIDQFDPRLRDDCQSEVIALCDQAGRQRKIVAMSSGDTLIWHPPLPHRGSIIKDRGRIRLSMVNHVIARNASIGGMKQFFHRSEASPSDLTFLAYD